MIGKSMYLCHFNLKKINMKKILVVLSLVCFVAVNAVNAQTPAPTAKETKKEAAATPAATAKATPAATCHGSATKSCCKNGDAKACTPAQRAACADKAKAEAATPGAETNPANN